MKLTQRDLAPSIGYEDIVHIVLVNDNTQDPSGSSYKGTIQQIIDLAPKDSFVTGGTYNDTTGITTFTNSTGTTFNVSGYFKPSDDVFVSGVTFNNGNYELSIERTDGVTITSDLSILATDMNITGGTYNSITGVATFYDNSGSTFDVTGFLTGVAPENLQKEITTDYQLTDNDNNYTILVNNGTSPITITVPSGLLSKINIGFIQQGTGDVNFTTLGTTINSPLNMLKIKGQNYWAYLEQITNTNVYQLVGSLKL